MNDFSETDRFVHRLIDGELSVDELRKRLPECDSDPSLWKSIAVAFIESQILSRELKTLRSAGSAETIETRELRVNKKVPIHVASRSRKWKNALAIAALGLVAFWSGAIFRSLSFGTNQEQDKPSIQQVVQQNPQTSKQKKPLKSDSLQFVVGEPNGFLRQIEVPLVSSFDDLRADQFDLSSDDLLKELRRSGRDVEVQRTFMPVRLQDGRDVIVPIDKLRVRQNRYQ